MSEKLSEETEWFWRIVDEAGLADVPSDEQAALRLLVQRAARAEARPAVDREAAWLIEWPANRQMPVRYWHPTEGHVLDANDAVRFCRREDAEAMLKRDHLFGGAKAVEHIWTALLSPATSPGEGKAEVLAENILALSKGYPQDEINFYRSRNAGIWRREVQSARAILAAMADPSRDNAGGGG